MVASWSPKLQWPPYNKDPEKGLHFREMTIQAYKLTSAKVLVLGVGAQAIRLGQE